MEGEVVFYRIFDLGASIDLEEVRRGRRTGIPMELRMARDKAMPRYISLPEPILVGIDEVVLDTTVGLQKFEVVAKLFGVGAISVMLRTSFSAQELPALRGYSSLAVREEGRALSLDDYAGRLFHRIRDDLRPYLEEAYEISVHPEPYLVFCISHPDITPEVWVKSLRAEVTALLTNDPHPERLSGAEVEDTWRSWLSYYHDDLFLVESDAALVVEPSGKYEDTLAVLELANLQLLEFRTYDAYLDKILDKAYDDMDRMLSRRGLLFSGRRMLKALGEVRMDLAEMTDATENISKLFGDWYLAKVYLACKQKFDLGSWTSTVEAKQAALSEIYDMGQREVEARRTFLLEVMVVLLFVLDLFIIALR